MQYSMEAPVHDAVYGRAVIARNGSRDPVRGDSIDRANGLADCNGRAATAIVNRLNPPSSKRDISARPRVLLIADGCNPQMTSVPLEGYCHSEALRQVADVLVVTHVRNRNDLTAVGWKEGKDFLCIDTEAVSRLGWKIGTLLRGGHGAGWTTLAALTVPLYYLFEQRLWEMLGSRIAAGEFDVVHRLIPLSPATPSTIAARCKQHGVHFVVGPVNGGLPWPAEFVRERAKEREWLSYLRSFHKLLPAYRSTHTCASAIIVGSRDAMRQMPRGCRDRCFYIAENAIEPKRFPDVPREERPAASPLRIAFIGRLVPYKGADMLIEAAADLLREGKLSLEIVGDGPQMNELRAQLTRLQLVDRVKLLGWLNHHEVSAVLNRSDVMAFPSIREFGGAVVIEAMAVGVVPIVIDYGGPAELITERTGFYVQPGTREQIVERFSKLLRRLCDSPEQVTSRSEPARLRARTYFTWEAKAKRVLQVYRWILSQTKDKPTFAMPTPDDGS